MKCPMCKEEVFVLNKVPYGESCYKCITINKLDMLEFPRTKLKRTRK